MARDEYRHGDPNVICDYSGFKCKMSETRLMWNGLRVRKDFWEPRHPQDYIRARYDDRQTLSDSAPDSDRVFLTEGSVSADTFAGTVSSTSALQTASHELGSVTVDDL